MLFGVRIYDKFMNLIKEIKPKQVVKKFWADKESLLTTPPSFRYKKRTKPKKGNKDAGTTKRNSTKRQGKKRVRRSGRAR